MRTFSLRSLLFVVTSLAIAFGYFMFTVHRQRTAVNAVLYGHRSAAIAYGELGDGLGSYSATGRPAALDYLAEPTGAELVNAVNADTLCVHLGRLRWLRVINLRGSDLTDAGLFHLASLRHIEILGLSGTHVTDNGLAELRKCKSLTALYLDGTNVTDRGILALGNLDNLKHTSLSNTRVTRSGRERLKELLPRCAVRH